MFIRFRPVGERRPSRNSWHVIRTWTRVPNVALTLCGKRASGPAADDFGGEKTCESCARIALKAQETAA